VKPNHDICATVLGHSTEPLVIVEVPAEVGPSVPDLRSYWNRGYFLAGFCGYIDGAMQARCEPSAEAVFTMAEAAPLFARLVYEKIKAQRGVVTQDFEKRTQWIH